MHLGFQAHARHTQWLAYALLVIDDVFLRQDVQHLLVRRNGNRLPGIQYAFDIGLTTSRSRIATMPLELRLRMWLPAIPA